MVGLVRCIRRYGTHSGGSNKSLQILLCRSIRFAATYRFIFGNLLYELKNLQYDTGNINSIRILFCILVFEFCLFIFSGVGLTSLANNTFFNLNADPAYWVLFGLKLPQTVIGHYWLAWLIDAAIIFSLIIIIYDPFNNKVALVLFLLLLFYYLTLTAYLTHRNYQSGFFLVMFPFIFRKDSDKHFAFETLRYFLLFFYFSAAILKLTSHSLTDPGHLSEMLQRQFLPYFHEKNTGLRTTLNLYLIRNQYLSYSLFIFSFLMELLVIIGFFTRKFDRQITTGLLLFHLANWLIMDIAPFGQVAFVCILFYSARFLSMKNKRSIDSSELSKRLISRGRDINFSN